MMYKDGIKIYENALSKEFCDVLITYLNNEYSFKYSEVNEFENYISLIFSNEWDIKFKSYLDELDVSLNQNIRYYYDQFLQKNGTNDIQYNSNDISERKIDLFNRCTPYELLMTKNDMVDKLYSFNWSTETNIVARQIEVFYFLNDGAKIEFINGDVYNPTSGSIIIFPTNFMYPYRFIQNSEVYMIRTFLTNFYYRWKHRYIKND